MVASIKARVNTARQDGFTLVELLIVIVILGVLAGIVVFAVGNSKQDADTAACQATNKTVSVAAEAYKAKAGVYPTFAQLTPQLKDITGLVEANYNQGSGTYAAPGC